MKVLNKICISLLVSLILLFNIPFLSSAEVTSDTITNSDLIKYVSQSIGFNWSLYNGDDIYNDFLVYCNNNNLKSDCVGTLVADTLSIPKDTYNNITSFLGTFTYNKVSGTIYSNGFIDLGVRFKTVKDKTFTSFKGVYFTSLNDFKNSFNFIQTIDNYNYYFLNSSHFSSFSYFFDDGFVIDGISFSYGISSNPSTLLSLKSSVSLSGRNLNCYYCLDSSCSLTRYSAFTDDSIVYEDNGYYYYIIGITKFSTRFFGCSYFLEDYYFIDSESLIKFLWTPYSISDNSFSYSFSDSTQYYIDTPSSSNVTIIINNIGTSDESILSPDYTSALGDIKDLITYYGDKLLEQNNINSEIDNNIIDNANSNKDTFNDTSSKFNEIEKGFSDDLDSNLNNISTNTDFSFNGGGSYFKNSINWVNTQFNNMTNNTPFGSLLGFSLILGLALLLLGKLFK